MFRFGEVVVDPRAREVRRAGRTEHLEPQAFDLLIHLIEHRDEVVAKHDLLDGVWGHRFVSEAALTTRVKEIRRVLGDDGATQHTIRNVRGRGYRFVAELDGRSDRVSSRLVGRDSELATISRRFGTSPVVTLVGPGGVGKSTLARAVMGALASGTLDTVMVELAPLAAGDDVLPAITRALDTALEPERPDRAAAAIAGIDVLLLLDNCEHVVDEVADVVDRIVATPGCRARVLATSQVRLGVAVEQVVAIGPLDRDGALALFTARASAIEPACDLTGVGAGRVGELLDHLDRLPLTIEMAAARLATMTFDELEAAVLDGARLAQMTHRTPTRRHRTLGSLVEWSAELLSPEQRRAFVDFSVFAGSVPMADAALVLGPDAPVTVTDLADRSLLAADLTGSVATYRMLDTVQTVARRWLKADPACDAVHRRHARAITDAALAVDQLLRSPDEPAGRRRLDEIVAEVRHAHRWARANDPDLADRLGATLHLASYGRLWSEPGAWGAEVLAAAAAAAPGALAGSRLLVAGAAANAAQLDVARAEGERVLASTDEPHLCGIAHEILSDVAIYSGRLDDCAGHVTALMRLGADLGDAHMVAIATVNDSLMHTFAGDPDAGVRRLAVDAAAMSPTSRAWLAYARGEALAALGDSAGAVAAFGEATRRAGAVRNPFVVSVAQSSLATVHARTGSVRAAYEVYSACLRGYLRHGNVVHAVTTVRNLVSLLHADGDLRGAAVLGVATTNDELRPTYGSESQHLDAVLGEVASTVPPDRYASWVAEGGSLDLDGVVLRAAAIVDAHLSDGEHDHARSSARPQTDHEQRVGHRGVLDA